MQSWQENGQMLQLFTNGRLFLLRLRTGYLSLIKYCANKIEYTRCSLFSIEERFAVWLKHFVDNVDNKIHNYSVWTTPSPRNTASNLDY